MSSGTALEIDTEFSISFVNAAYEVFWNSVRCFSIATNRSIKQTACIIVKRQSKLVAQPEPAYT